MSSEEKSTNGAVCINCHEFFNNSKRASTTFVRCKSCAKSYRKTPCQCLVDGKFCYMIAGKTSQYCSSHRYLPRPENINFIKHGRTHIIYRRYDRTGQVHNLYSIDFGEDNATLPKDYRERARREPKEPKGPNLFSASPHDILGIPPNASTSEIRRAYKALCLLHHPDRNPTDKTAHIKFIKIKNAYDALMNLD